LVAGWRRLRLVGGGARWRRVVLSDDRSGAEADNERGNGGKAQSEVHQVPQVNRLLTGPAYVSVPPPLQFGASSMRIISSFANTMTPARQQRKRYRVGGAAIAGLLLALSTGLPVTSAATTERIVVDWHTGLAIGGYDPVAFFTDGKPIAGRQISNCATVAPSGASATSGTRRRLPRGPMFMCRNSAATIRSASPAAWRSREVRTTGSSAASGCSCSTIRLGAKNSPPTRSGRSPQPTANGRRSRVH